MLTFLKKKSMNQSISYHQPNKINRWQLTKTTRTTWMEIDGNQTSGWQHRSINRLTALCDFVEILTTYQVVILSLIIIIIIIIIVNVVVMYNSWLNKVEVSIVQLDLYVVLLWKHAEMKSKNVCRVCYGLPVSRYNKQHFKQFENKLSHPWILKYLKE